MKTYSDNFQKPPKLIENKHLHYRLEPFLSALQNMGLEFLHGVENFHQDKVLFLQVVYNCLHAAKMHFMKLLLEIFLGICIKNAKKCQLRRILDQICKHQ